MSAPERSILRRAAWIATLADGGPGPRRGRAMGALGIVHDASVVLEGDRIAWVGPDAQLTGRGAELEIDCRGLGIVPAFVDSHTHAVWSGNRLDELEARLSGADYEQILAAGGGILSTVRQTRSTAEDELVRQSLVRLRRMRACGTTSFEIKSGYGLDLETELRQLRAARRLATDHGFRVRTTCLAAHAVPAEARADPAARAAFVDRICGEILPAVAGESLADYCDVFCDRGAFDVDESRRVLLRARELGLGLRVHANELGHTGGAGLAAELGACSADHLLHLDAAERSALARAGVIATLLPGTSLVLGKTFADGRALIDAGVPVAVATDCNPGSCPLENLGMVMGLACFGCRLSPAEALTAVTHNAAVALGLDTEVGRLAPGLAADLLVLDADDYRSLIAQAGSPVIRHVFSAGRRIEA
jgi:imidazolonepropionase